MIAIHNIKSMIAVPGAFDDSHYIMLEFTPDGTDEQPVTMTLYFATNPLVHCQLAALCRAINSSAPGLDPEPEPYQTISGGRVVPT